MNEKEYKYLRKVADELNGASGHIVPGSEELSNQIMDVIRKQKGLTYFTAYAALQYTHNRLVAEANFVQTQPAHSLVDLVKQSLAEDGLGK